MAARIADILADKGNDVVTVGTTASVAEVVALLTRHGIGAVVVVDDADQPQGLVSERDVVHAVGRAGAQALGTAVADVMSTDVPACTPTARVDDVAALMTQGRHRHVPVIVGGELLGIVSVGDVVRSRIDNLAQTAEQLRAYVAGGY